MAYLAASQAMLANESEIVLQLQTRETRRYLSGCTKPAAAFGEGPWARVTGNISVMVPGNPGPMVNGAEVALESGTPAKLLSGKELAKMVQVILRIRAKQAHVAVAVALMKLLSGAMKDSQTNKRFHIVRIIAGNGTRVQWCRSGVSHNPQQPQYHLQFQSQTCSCLSNPIGPRAISHFPCYSRQCLAVLS